MKYVFCCASASCECGEQRLGRIVNDVGKRRLAKQRVKISPTIFNWISPANDDVKWRHNFFVCFFNDQFVHMNFGQF